MRTHIVGTVNHYFKTAEDASLGICPEWTSQRVARINPDHQTWMVYDVDCAPFPAELLPKKLGLMLAVLSAMTAPVERDHLVTRRASLKEAYDLVSGHEQNPPRLPEYPVVRQSYKIEDTNDYWRNIPQPA